MSSSVSVSAGLYFPRAGDLADNVLASFVDQPCTDLRLAIYSLNNPKITSAIILQQQSGVNVRLITDHLESFGTAQLSALRTLKAAGVPIKTNHHTGIMHLKLAIRDLSALTSGSFNWTTNAESVNDEILVVLENYALAKQSADVFDCMWADSARFVDWTPPTAAQLSAMHFERPEF